MRWPLYQLLSLRGRVASAVLSVGMVSLLLALGGCQQAAELPAKAEPTPNAAPLFDDVTERSGVNCSFRNGEEAGHFAILESLGGGVALIDFDNDGLLDLFVPGGGSFAGPDKKQIKGSPCKLYKNLGNFQFKDVTADVFPQQPDFYTHGASVADYDRDHWPDLLVTGYGRVALYRNVPVDPKQPARGRRLVDVTREAGLRSGLLGKHFWATSAAFGDLDGDGYPELYVCQYANWSWANNPICSGYTNDVRRDVCPPKQFAARPHALYHNVPANDNDSPQARKFVDATRSAGIRIDRADQEYGKGLGVVMADVNGDGLPDIYVANDTVDNFLYVNRSKPGVLKFDDKGLELGVARDDRGVPNGSMGVDAGDPFGSGRPSLWCTNYENEMHALYRSLRHNGRQSFAYNTQAAGIGAIGTLYVGFGTGFVDVDNDGWEDLVIVNGHVIRYPKQTTVRQKPVLLLNRGEGRFQEASARGGAYFLAAHRGRGLAIGDLDNDGRPDLVISNVNEPVGILRNISPAAHHWLGVRLAAKNGADFVGARVTLQVGGKKLTRFAKGGGSYLSAGDRRQLFGLGTTDKVGRLTVEWPSGEPRVQHWDGLTSNRYYRLLQGQANAEVLPPAGKR